MSYSDVTIIDGIRITIALFIATISMWVLIYTYDLEKAKCVCALNGHIHLFRIIFIFQFALIAVAIFRPLPSHAVGVFGTLWLLFIVFGLKFIHDMKRTNCACSDMPGRLMMERLLYASLFFYIGFIISHFV
jgi:hypothetical protein